MKKKLNQSHYLLDCLFGWCWRLLIVDGKKGLNKLHSIFRNHAATHMMGCRKKEERRRKKALEIYRSVLNGLLFKYFIHTCILMFLAATTTTTRNKRKNEKENKIKSNIDINK